MLIDIADIGMVLVDGSLKQLANCTCIINISILWIITR